MAAFSFEKLEVNGHQISAKVEGSNAAELGPQVVEHLKELDNQQTLGDEL